MSNATNSMFYFRVLMVFFVTVCSVAGCNTLVKIPPSIERQPTITSMEMWGNEIALVATSSGKNQHPGLYLFDAERKTFRRFTSLACDSIYNVAVSDGSLFLTCLDSEGVFVYRSEAPDGEWRRVSDRLSGSSFRLAVRKDLMVVISDSDLYVQRGASAITVPLAQIEDVKHYFQEARRSGPRSVQVLDNDIYIAYNNGEWGGALYRIGVEDLRKAELLTARNIDTVAINGRKELWAAGGVLHIHTAGAFVYKVGKNQIITYINEYDSPHRGGKKKLLQPHPLFELPGGSNISALCFSWEGRPLILGPFLGIFEVSPDKLVPIMEKDLLFTSKTRTSPVGTSYEYYYPIAMKITKNKEIYIGTAGIGLLQVSERDGKYQLTGQYLLRTGRDIMDADSK